MTPLPNGGQFEGANLEDRLRGLIINNDSPRAGGFPPGLVQEGSHPVGPGSSFRREQQSLSHGQEPQERPPPVSPTATRRRPNQAQRRQQNSQLSIPIDPRPMGPITHAGGTYNPPPGFHRSSWQASPYGSHPNLPDPQSFGPQKQQYMQFANNTNNASLYGAQTGPAMNTPMNPSYAYHRQRDGHHFDGNYAPRQGSGTQLTWNNSGPQEFGFRGSPGRQQFPAGSYGTARGSSTGMSNEELAAQGDYLNTLAAETVALSAISPAEYEEKNAFRIRLEIACREAIARYEKEHLQNSSFDPLTVEVKCFGSMASGFATKGSDMDLALLTPQSEPSVDSNQSEIPRILEKLLLDLGFGARLLTRTRVPIIKLCEQPTEQLRADLLDARHKWEVGLVAESEEVLEVDGDGDIIASQSTIEQSKLDSPTKSGPNDEGKYLAHLSSLKQKPGQSLNEYFGNAKRLLKRLAGRDLNIGCDDDLTPEQYEIANDVSKAFVQGLSDQTLVDRLLSYRSISFDKPVDPNRVRSLSSLFQVIEGERLALAWDLRPLPEGTKRQETDAFRHVQEWIALQDVETFDSASHKKNLHVAGEKLRRVSSLQLVYLEQGQHEEPLQYYNRVCRIMRDLGGDDRINSQAIAQEVTSRYISGISNAKIREQLQSIPSPYSLADISDRHRILQLASQYETGLTNNLFEDAHRPDVEAYIELLTESILSVDESSDVGSLQYKIPTTTSTQALVRRIRSLPDPTQGNKRAKYQDHLEFPKSGVGVQCDINFSAQLALHNTLLLRCYSHCDPRVRPMILFVKHWAKTRGVNTPYRGTLSSYGYVLMVLHYLVNVAVPFVCPNLQALHRPPPPHLSPEDAASLTECNGCDVQFWKNEDEIKDLAIRGLLNHNHSTVGALLRGFFEYYAQTGQISTGNRRGFDWGREVLSLRTLGGIVTKQDKGWVGARTVTETTSISTPSKQRNGPSTSTAPEARTENKIVEVKEIRHRYLFAIEDPFELDHNVARTVTHEGIVSIRDEFRRAWRIIRSAGKGHKLKENLLDEVVTKGPTKSSLQELLDLLHGPEEPEAGRKAT